jgi:hypothetical protein
MGRSEFNNVLIRIVALGAFEGPQIKSRSGGLDSSYRHSSAALRARRRKGLSL